MTRSGKAVLCPDPDMLWLPAPEVSGEAVVTLPHNATGRDLFAGDIHGQAMTFAAAVEMAGFRPDRGDRLFLVGDLIDRGPRSDEMLEWLSRPGVHCVRGNHEQLLIDAVRSEDLKSDAHELWEMNGGQWGYDVPVDRLRAWYDACIRLPFAIEIEPGPDDEGREPIVVVHAETPEGWSWPEYRASLRDPDGKARIHGMWARERINSATGDTRTEGARWTVHGHTPLREVVRKGNAVWIDTGAAYADRYDGARVTITEMAPGTGQWCARVAEWEHEARRSPG